MNFFDKCKYLTVIVGDGSGVIFQPSENYSYILTAKHNLKDNLSIITYDGDNLNIQKCYKHEILDIAIIKVEKIDSPEILIQKEKPEYLKKYKIYGYPVTRRKNDKEDKILDYDLEITSNSNKNYNIDVRNADSSPYEEVVGFSGGGLFNAENTNENIVYLAGIECKMTNEGDEDEKETHNRLRFISINAFDEIIKKYSDELVEIYKEDAKIKSEKKYIFLIIIIIILLFIGIYNYIIVDSNKINLTGRVVNCKEGIPKVTVYVKNHFETHTKTNQIGYFEIKNLNKEDIKNEKGNIMLSFSNSPEKDRKYKGEDKNISFCEDD